MSLDRPLRVSIASGGNAAHLKTGGMRMKTEEQRFLHFLRTFNSRSTGRIVYLERKADQDSAFSFQVKFRMRDSFARQEPYDEGIAVIYLSDTFYTKIEELALAIMGKIPLWNNTRSIGCFVCSQEKEKKEIVH